MLMRYVLLRFCVYVYFVLTLDFIMSLNWNFWRNNDYDGDGKGYPLRG